MLDISFYKGKRVFLTGHTGFKGSWMVRVLLYAGAEVTGYSLDPPTTPNLYTLSNVDSHINSIIGDVRDFEKLKKAFLEADPEIVIHMAAQPIVRESYRTPRVTYDINVMGTVNLLECTRISGRVRSFLNVTTDKVYQNKEWYWGYRENEALDGYDPYSNSKSCSELVTHCYYNSFFSNTETAISTARAGNVIGGGDFAVDRIIPDCIRAQQQDGVIAVRNPYSTRPYQHVLEPVMAYLMIAQSQFLDKSVEGWYNVGPDEQDCVTTGRLVDLFCNSWGGNARWENIADENAPHEANYLKLDCTKLKVTFGWSPRWHIKRAVELTCRWSKVWCNKGDVAAEMDSEIEEYLSSDKAEYHID